MNKRTSVEVAGKELSLSNLDKVLYAEAGFTKGEAINYYAGVADVLLPHLAGRPVTLKRYPEGVDKGFFYEKQCPSHRPGWVKTVRVPTERQGGHTDYCLINDVPSLVWLANLASLELHVSLARAEDIDEPGTIVFDLDPGPPATLLECLPVAFALREILDELWLQSFPKSSGGKGLHVYVPLNTPVTYEQTKPFAHAIAGLLEARDASMVTTNMRKELRAGKVFVDWSQNDAHKTTVCVYSLRARARPTVSTPLSWDELRSAHKRHNAKGLVLEAEDMPNRIKREGDLFEPVLTLRQRLPKIYE